MTVSRVLLRLLSDAAKDAFLFFNNAMFLDMWSEQYFTDQIFKMK